MISSRTLEEAVATGVISADQRNLLVGLEHASAQQDQAPADEASADDGADENLRLVGGGNDLFVTVGTVLLVSGFYFVLTTLIEGQAMWIAAGIALLSWAIAEIVTRQHRMKLSSSVLALFFTGALLLMLSDYVNRHYQVTGSLSFAQILALRSSVSEAGYILLGGIIAGSIVHFWRFRVPILAGVVAVAATLLVFLQTAIFIYDGVTTGQMAVPAVEEIPELVRAALYMPLLCGLVVFAIGVALDIHDRERLTIWSDCAFWLHVVSAPMLVHPLFILATGQDVVFGRIEPGTDATIMLTLLILAFVYVALAIDRRSLLVPTFAYFGSLGIYYMLSSAADSTGIHPFALIMVVVGALIILFGAGWQRIRRLIVRPTLPTFVLDRLPPLKA